MNIMQRILSLYMPYAPQRFVYMLQRVEYQASAFLRWLMRLPHLGTIQYRGSLKPTAKARGLLVIAYTMHGLAIVLIVALALYANIFYLLGLVFVPLVTVIVLAGITELGARVLHFARRGSLIEAKELFTKHQAVKIAVLGSYGKTTMKELLATVLSEGKQVASTPGNMNVPLSHARWAKRRLNGTEEVIILEYGEGEPGDIAAFADLTSPDYAVLTGIAPNHLDRYSNYEALQDDLRTINQYVAADRLYCNQQAADVIGIGGAITYDQQHVGVTTIREAKATIEGVAFTLITDGEELAIQSPLLGLHQVGPLAAVASIARELGLTPEQIRAGIAKTVAYEHRMQPRQLHGAWIIDDTYNGNLEGIRAGLALLQTLEARRKIYVTPGLVDQGAETERVHTEIGMLIAKARPDTVVLMENSVTGYIQAGLTGAGYSGEVVVEPKPKEFYENIEQHVAAGELYMLQNDWPDEYR